jgi:hypothetical protein
MLVSHGSDRHSPLMIGGLQLAQAASFVSSSRGWVLGGTQPAQPSEWRIVATVDGGRSWHTQLDVRIAG